MPLTLVLGPANSAKAGEVLSAYAAAARRGALLVVPTGADAEHYRRELAQQGSVLGSVLTFAGLAGETGSYDENIMLGHRYSHLIRMDPKDRSPGSQRARRGPRASLPAGPPRGCPGLNAI